MFCPFIKDTCNSECVFYDKHNRTGNSKCRLEAAVINLEYIGDFIAAHESEFEERAQDHQCSDTSAK